MELELSDADRIRIEKIWAKVFESSNRIIFQHQKFGFQGVEQLPHPDVHMMVTQLKVFSALIDIILLDLPYNEQRMLLNAKRQIANMELLAVAVSTNNQQDYQSAVEALERQAVF